MNVSVWLRNKHVLVVNIKDEFHVFYLIFEQSTEELQLWSLIQTHICMPKIGIHVSWVLLINKLNATVSILCRNQSIDRTEWMQTKLFVYIKNFLYQMKYMKYMYIVHMLSDTLDTLIMRNGYSQVATLVFISWLMNNYYLLDVWQLVKVNAQWFEKNWLRLVAQLNDNIFTSHWSPFIIDCYW